MSRLKDKIILITGGNGLLGKEIILKLSLEGAFCINADVNHETSEDLSRIQCDITSCADIDSKLSFILAKYGRIDGLVNNAYPRSSDWGLKFEDIPYSSWQQNVDVQLNSYFYLSQQVSKQMVLKGNGSIINMASVYGMVGPDFGVYKGTNMTMPAAYSVIKGGLINFTRYLASYLGQHNIRVNAVSPGGVFNSQNPVFVQNYNERVPMRRMGTAEDIAPLVVFLLSDEAKYITGQNIAVDGGWTCI